MPQLRAPALVARRTVVGKQRLSIVFEAVVGTEQIGWGMCGVHWLQLASPGHRSTAPMCFAWPAEGCGREGSGSVDDLTRGAGCRRSGMALRPRDCGIVAARRVLLCLHFFPTFWLCFMFTAGLLIPSSSLLCSLGAPKLAASTAMGVMTAVCSNQKGRAVSRPTWSLSPALACS